jgi:archaemetzincin
MTFSPEQLLSIFSQDAKPLPIAHSNDWRAQHPNEIRQSFRTISKPRNRDIHANSSVALYATPDVFTDFPEALDCLKSFLGAYFQVLVSGWSTLSLGEIASHDRRKQQIRTTALLRQLPPRRKLEKRLILTAYDLFPDEDSCNFVFGEADYLESRAIVSLFHYDIPRRAPLCDIPLVRVLKVASHELGHLFALEHCLAHLCNMNGVNHVAELDSHPLDLCPECLAKWAWFSSPDVQRRFADLRTLYVRYNLRSEQDSVSRCISLLERTGNA